MKTDCEHMSETTQNKDVSEIIERTQKTIEIMDKILEFLQEARERGSI